MKKESSSTAVKRTARSVYQSPAIQEVELRKSFMLNTSMNTSESRANEKYLDRGSLDEDF